MKEYFLDLWDAVSSTVTGMAITLRHLFMVNETQQYLSEEKPETRWNSVIVPEGLLQDRSRMRLYVKMEDSIGCLQCEKACPLDCITITTEKREKTEPPIFPSNGQGIKQRVVQFDIDMSLCCYCSLCVYPCPTDCIVMTPEYEFAERDKTNFLYRFAKDKPTPPAPPEEKKEAEPVAAG